MEIFVVLTLLIWLAGAALRRAHLIAVPTHQAFWRSLPNRVLTSWFVGCALAFFLSEAPGSALPGVITTAAALVAVLPRGVTVSSMSSVAVVLVLLLAGIGSAVALSLPADLPEFRAITAATLGFVGYLIVPLSVRQHS